MRERNDTNLGFVSLRPRERPTRMSVLSDSSHSLRGAAPEQQVHANLGFACICPQERPTRMSVLSVKLEVKRNPVPLEVGLLLGQELITEFFKPALLLELLEKQIDLLAECFV